MTPLPLGCGPSVPRPLTRALLHRTGGVPGPAAPQLPALHHLPGLRAGPISGEAQGEEPGPGEGEGPGPRPGGGCTEPPPGLTAPSLQLEPWLCRAYLEAVQREGVSSLDSGSLSLCLSSSNSLYEDLEHFLEHFMMEVEQAA